MASTAIFSSSDSILDSIKALLGVAKDYTVFDDQITMDINTALMHLNTLGVGVEPAFTITGSGETWTDLLAGVDNLNSVRSYVYLQVRILFDPPQNSFMIDAMKSQLAEIEFRLTVQAEHNSAEEISNAPIIS